jgi:hypothetical protein
MQTVRRLEPIQEILRVWVRNREDGSKKSKHKPGEHNPDSS